MEQQRTREDEGRDDGNAESGAVDHDRPAGVPPTHNEDLDGHDESVAESFPASDPPANY